MGRVAMLQQRRCGGQGVWPVSLTREERLDPGSSLGRAEAVGDGLAHSSQRAARRIGQHGGGRMPQSTNGRDGTTAACMAGMGLASSSTAMAVAMAMAQ